MYRTLYRKIPKISPGAYIFQRPFLRGLYTEGNLRFKPDWASLIVGRKFTVFACLYFVFEGNFPSTSPRGAYIWRGDLTEGFLRYRFGGLISGGAYTWRGLFSEFYGTLSLVCYWPGTRIKLRPHADKLIQMMWTKDGLVTSKVFKVIHDDSHEKIKHLANKQW